MRAVAWCVVDGGSERIALAHGDIIGRTSTAALVVDDSRISEAHALVSLRGGSLHLLGLRGRFRVAGKVLAEAVLREGLTIELAEGLMLEVVEVQLPASVLGIQGPGLSAQVLPGTVSLDAKPMVRLRPGWQPDAAAVLWSVDETWRIAVRGQPARLLEAGDQVDIDGWPLEAVLLSLGAASAPRTQVDLTLPLFLEACFDTVQLTIGGRPKVVLGGQPGRILSELIELAGPVDWALVARQIWPGDGDLTSLRRRWDVALSRLRGRLRVLGVRGDLIQTDGAGHVAVVLRSEDRAVVVG